MKIQYKKVLSRIYIVSPAVYLHERGMFRVDYASDKTMAS